MIAYMYSDAVAQCGETKSAVCTVCVCVLQAMMEKLSLEVEKTLKLNSQLEETGDSKKVCTISCTRVCKPCATCV